MAHIPTQVATDLATTVSNPQVFAGSGGQGVSFKSRLALRTAMFQVAGGTTNLELTAATNPNFSTIETRAVALATT